MYYSKYKAHKCKCKLGHTHDSKKEAYRCNELNQLLELGTIADLQIQKPYLLIKPIIHNIPLNDFYKQGKKKGQQKYKKITEENAVYYKADFVYYDKLLNKTIIEDTKGMKTKEYIIKRKLMKTLYCNENVLFLET